MKPEGRAIAVAQLLRAGHSAQQISKALAVTDSGGSVADAMAALREPDERGYLDKLRSSQHPHKDEGR